MSSLKLHNAMWPGLVGKGGDEAGAEPVISLERMLELTVKAEVKGQKFDGVDLFLFHPHINPDIDETKLLLLADSVANMGLKIGSLVAPVWPGTVGDSAMGNPQQRAKFILAIRKSVRIAEILNDHGVREYGVIRIDSADSPENWEKNKFTNTKKISETFREAGIIAAAHGERLAVEGEICWAGMHSWKHVLKLLEKVGMPGTVGFQADMAHTFLYLFGYNSPDNTLLSESYSKEEFYGAYKIMTDALRPWTIDFHVAQNDGTIHGSGNHDKTGRHCQADDPNGKLDIIKASGYWFDGIQDRGVQHICWDGCMFPNSVLENPETWNNVLKKMIEVRNAHAHNWE